MEILTTFCLKEAKKKMRTQKVSINNLFIAQKPTIVAICCKFDLFYDVIYTQKTTCRIIFKKLEARDIVSS